VAGGHRSLFAVGGCFPEIESDVRAKPHRFTSNHDIDGAALNFLSSDALYGWAIMRAWCRSPGKKRLVRVRANLISVDSRRAA